MLDSDEPAPLSPEEGARRGSGMHLILLAGWIPASAIYGLSVEAAAGLIMTGGWPLDLAGVLLAAIAFLIWLRATFSVFKPGDGDSTSGDAWGDDGCD